MIKIFNGVERQHDEKTLIGGRLHFPPHHPSAGNLQQSDHGSDSFADEWPLQEMQLVDLFGDGRLHEVR